MARYFGGVVFATLLAAVSIPGSHVQAADLAVSVNVVSSGCTITGSTLNFSNYTSGQSADLDSQTALSINCPGDVVLNYSPGINPNIPNRSMSSESGTGEFLDYQLYINTFGGIIAGGADGFGVSQAVSGAAGPQTVTVYGRVFGNQTVSPGDYSDVVQVTMTVN